MMWKPNTFYLVGHVARDSESVSYKQQWIVVINDTGDKERDLFYKRASDKWQIDVEYASGIWLTIADLDGYEPLKEWNTQEEMMIEMFQELM